MNNFTTKIALISTGTGEGSLLSEMLKEPFIEIIGLSNPNIEELKTATEFNIPVKDVRHLLQESPDIVINLSLDEDILVEIMKYKRPETEVVNKKSADMIRNLLEKRQNKSKEIKNLLNEAKDLYRIGVAITSSETIEDALNTLLIEATRFLNVSAGSIVLYDRNNNSFTVKASRGISEDLLNSFQCIKGTGGLTEHIINKRIPTVISDIGNYNFSDSRELLENGIISLMATPLFAGEVIIGIIYVCDFKKRDWSDREIEFIIHLGIQAAYAIEKFKLIETITKKNLLLEELNDRLEDKVIEKTAELAKANKELERSNKLKSQFIATMSHELRTPINSILGFSELLLDQTFGPLTEKQKRYVNNIYNAGSHLLHLINNILDIAKIESGRMELNYESFSVRQAIEEVEDVVRPLIKKKKLNFSSYIDEKVSIIKADRVKFKQILYNLLSNAIKFTPESGNIIIKAEVVESNVPWHPEEPVQYRISIPFRQLHISVIDNGIGIKKEDHELIFTEFVQLDSTLARKYEGTGLGLALTRRFVEMHGGMINVESEEGKGSTFNVFLPLFDVDFLEKEMIKITKKSQEIPSYEELQKKRRREIPLILVVEDDPSTSEMLTLFLKQGGYNVAHAYNGDDALEKVKKLKPFAVLLDVMLPGKDGWEVLQELKSDPETRDIPVIISSIIDNKELGFALGASDYIVKPFDKDYMLKKLDELCFTINQGKKMANILCIDDNPEVLEMLISILEPAGYNVISANSGQQGLECALAFKPDLIILDLLMSEIDGFEFVRTIKANPYTMHIPILIFTAKELTIEDRLMLAGKIENIVQKTHFAKEDLLNIIRDLEVTYPERSGLLDEVSGLFDHSYFQIRLAQEVSRAERHKNVISLLMLDIDDFNRYIKKHGVYRGNIVIKKIAEFLRKSLRGSDIAVRYGIDEFAIILYNTPIKSSEIVAERISEFIKGYPFYGQEVMPKGCLTASIAIASYPYDAKTSEELAFKVRQTMRRAKTLGGDRIEVYAKTA